MSGAVSLALLIRASSGWRCVIGIGGQGVVWVALCRSGTGMSRGVVRGVVVLVRVAVAARVVRVVAGLVRVVAVVRVRVLAGQNVSFLKAGLVQNRHF